MPPTRAATAPVGRGGGGAADAIAATVTVMDPDGKVVNTSRTVWGAFREAKEAYKRRKSELADQRAAESRARTALRNRASRHHRRHRQDRLALEDGGRKHRHSMDEIAVRGMHRNASVETLDADEEVTHTTVQVAPPSALNYMDQIMMLSPALMMDPAVETVQTLLAQVQSVIDEFACVSFGIQAFVDALKQTPDTLATVALALGEIAGLITKVAPGVIPILQSAFPTVFALISSPQFAVVAGAVGAASVVMLGGFRIVKGWTEAVTDDSTYTEEDGEERTHQVPASPAQSKNAKQPMIEAVPIVPTPPTTPPALPEPTPRRSNTFNVFDFQLRGKKEVPRIEDVTEKVSEEAESNVSSNTSSVSGTVKDKDGSRRRKKRDETPEERRVRKERERREKFDGETAKRREKKEHKERKKSVPEEDGSVKGSSTSKSKKEKEGREKDAKGTLKLKSLFQGRSA